jgi:hypothetical protein
MAERSEGSPAEQLRALVEAAERIRADAERDAAHAREAVARVGERADELDRRLDELAAGVRDAVAALKEEVAALRDAQVAPPPTEDPATRLDPSADDELIAEAEAAAARKPQPEAGEPDPEEPGPVAPEGARLLALKMALDGRPRAETASYLSENFELDDPEALLDEVYARAGREIRN